MKLIAQLEDLFYQSQRAPKREDLRVQDWRIVVHESEVVALGIKDNSPGSVYTPPSYRQGESGDIFLVWQDGTCSQAMVQLPLSGEPEYWQRELEQWRQASYSDPDAAHLPSPESLPLVAVEDRGIQSIIAGDDKILFDQADDWLREKPSQAKMQGSIQAAWGYRHVRTSTGLAVTYQQSQFVSWFSFDSLVGGGFAKRRLIQPEEQKQLWTQTVNQYEWMQKPAASVGPNTQVIFAPGMTEDMLRQFILPNFSGDRVIEGQGAFSKNSFLDNTQVFHEQLSLLIDPLRPLELGSYLVTPEGVPAQQTVLVQKGQLITPFLRVKDAVRWGAKPTAVPQGTAGLYLKHQAEVPWAKALEEVEDGVLILSVLGLHTQDSVSGSYSLSAPHSLRILKGQIVGKTDVKLTGNFLKDLAATTTRTAKSDLQTHPYLILKTGVQSL
ncbi:putative Zn-dependent protease-like protein [Desulfosporosinus orientis DSM 765]|uniref:Putative Zn-dependent protease-like protein n=1 Tax=Desulfosporosinus orientis (strain ATCC 19365 / DSM 765 / NCIMB 8382 / VKM B-1628 / Singapore I) TaxID=768706 RepID=G7WHF5_DESOD|nr:metallopeptidase TldD-related protein [Desulfosporosinus orientis]AET70245.1 putative Zn-dependent protease-like protein [Desulfosporosinus orientis DSM 765]